VLGLALFLSARLKIIADSWVLSGMWCDRRRGVGRQECRAQGLCSWLKELIDCRDYFVWEPHLALVKAIASGRGGGVEANLALSLPLEMLIPGNRSQRIQLRNRGLQCLKPGRRFWAAICQVAPKPAGDRSSVCALVLFGAH